MRKRKNPMPPIEIDGVEYGCGNADVWPPLEIEHLADTAEELRYTVPDLVYQRLKTWERACGILRMSEDKCPTCPFVMIDGEPATKAGMASASTIKNKRILRKR